MASRKNQNQPGRTPKKKGWWSRFLERVAKANEEVLKGGCKT